MLHQSSNATWRWKVVKICLASAVAVSFAQHSAAQPAEKDARQWRRTADGWERFSVRATAATPPQAVVAPRSPAVMHPALFAAIMAVVAIGALLVPARHQTKWRGPDRHRPPLRRQSDRAAASSSH